MIGIIISSHHRDRDEENESREEKEEERVPIEDLVDLRSVLANSVADVVHEKDEDHRPTCVETLDLLIQRWAREESKSNHEGEHDDEMVGVDVLASLE